MALDPIEVLAPTHATDVTRLLQSASQSALASIDIDAVEAILLDTNGDTARRRLVIALGLTDNAPDDLAQAFGASIALLATMVAAVAALAASRYSIVSNSADRFVIQAQQDAAKTLSNSLADTGLAISAAIERAIYSTASLSDRARQLVDSIGLTVNQANALDVMRQTLATYLSAPIRIAPRTTDINGNRIPATPYRAINIDRLLRSTRGILSAAQRATLAKAMQNVRLRQDDADELLSNHAGALRDFRLRTIASQAAHEAQEQGKLAGWRIAQRSGRLPADARRYWRTMQDEAVRHDHAQVPTMNPAGVALDQPFQTPLGQRMTPPLEMNCRCKAEIR